MYTKYDNYIIKMRGKTYTPIQVIQSPKNPDRLQVKYQVPVMNKSNLNNTYVVTFINEDTPKARVPDLIHRTGKYVEITFNYVNINIHNNFVIDNRKVDKNMSNDNATLYNINIIDGNTFVAYVIDNASKDEIQMKFQYHI